MLTKIKVGFWGFVIAAMVIGTWAYLFDPTKSEGRNESPMSLKVVFSGSLRAFEDPVSILVMNNNSAAGPPQLSHESPWVEPHLAATGTIVTLIATHTGHGRMLECSIIYKGVTYGPFPAQPVKANSTCVAQVTA